MTLIYPLFNMISWVQRGVVPMFDGLRIAVYDILDFVPLASAFAAVFVIMKLIRLVNDIESDDSNGGFGHVKLWDIIRPLVFYMLVLSTPKVITFIDSSIKYATDEISNRMTISSPDMTFDYNLKEYIGRVNDTKEKNLKEVEQNKIGLDKVMGKVQVGFQYYQDVFAAFIKFIVDALSGLVVYLMQFLLMCVGAIMLAMASIHLMLITFFAPFMFALSIFEPWKQNYLKLISNFVYYELWYPIISLINFIYGATYTRISELTGLESFGTVFAPFGQLGASFAGIIVNVLIIAICIVLMFSVPAISNKVISMSSSPDDNNNVKTLTKAVPGIGKLF